MGSERRRHPRRAGPYEGRWRGASGGAPCRITDVSISGCFVQSKVSPAQDEPTVVVIHPIDGQELVLNGRARYAERGLGFGVEFENVTDEQLERLHELMTASTNG